MIGAADVSANDGQYYVELKFAPSLKLVTKVRRFVASFFEVALMEPELNAKVAVTVHELLENAVKFSRDGEVFVRIVVGDGTKSKDILIETENGSNAQDIELLEVLFKEIADAKTPMDFYMMRMERSLDQPHSHLGLARVLVEAGMGLAYSVDSDCVRIRATRSFDEGRTNP